MSSTLGEIGSKELGEVNDSKEWDFFNYNKKTTHIIADYYLEKINNLKKPPEVSEESYLERLGDIIKIMTAREIINLNAADTFNEDQNAIYDEELLNRLDEKMKSQMNPEVYSFARQGIVKDKEILSNILIKLIENGSEKEASVIFNNLEHEILPIVLANIKDYHAHHKFIYIIANCPRERIAEVLSSYAVFAEGAGFLADKVSYAGETSKETLDIVIQCCRKLGFFGEVLRKYPLAYMTHLTPLLTNEELLEATSYQNTMDREVNLQGITSSTALIIHPQMEKEHVYLQRLVAVFEGVAKNAIEQKTPLQHDENLRRLLTHLDLTEHPQAMVAAINGILIAINQSSKPGRDRYVEFESAQEARETLQVLFQQFLKIHEDIPLKEEWFGGLLEWTKLAVEDKDIGLIIPRDEINMVRLICITKAQQLMKDNPKLVSASLRDKILSYEVVEDITSNKSDLSHGEFALAFCFLPKDLQKECFDKIAFEKDFEMLNFFLTREEKLKTLSWMSRDQSQFLALQNDQFEYDGWKELARDWRTKHPVSRPALPSSQPPLPEIEENP